MLKKLKNRYTVLGIIFFFLFAGMGLQLASLQIRNGESYTKLADERRVRTISVSGPRGKILDRYGRVIVTNRQGYKVQLYINEVPKKQLNDIILETIRIIEKSGDSHEDNMLIQVFTDGGYDWTTRDLTLWKTQNGIPENASAAQAFDLMREKLGVSLASSPEDTLKRLAFQYQANSGDMESGQPITLTNPIDSSYSSVFKDLMHQYPDTLKMENIDDDGKNKPVLQLLAGAADKQTLDSLWDALQKSIPEDQLTAPRLFPIAMAKYGKMDWSTRELRAWRKANGIKDEMDASSAFAYLRKKYDLKKDLLPQDARKVLSIRIAISQLGYKAYFPVLIANDISDQTVASIEEKSLELPGITVENEYIRSYPNGNLLSPSLGYIGKITADQAEAYKAKGYDLSSDLIGRTGLESSMEKYLKGQPGSKQVEVNTMGRTIRQLSEVQAIPGSNVILTIDAKVQKAAEDSLAETIAKIQKGEFGESFPNAKIGAAVAIDIKTGEVIAMASYPSYDPNLFASGTIKADIWKELNPRYPHPQDPNREDHDPTLPRPMLNNAITAAFPPGSTYKMVVGAGGLKEGVVGVTEKILDEGRYTKFSKTNAPACWIWNDYRTTHGYEDIVGAIRDSCNYYFFEVGTRMGIEKIEAYSKLFGLGVKSGIEIPGESAGTIAGEEFTNKFITTIVQNKIKALVKNKLDRELSPEESQNAADIADDIIRNFSINTVRKHLESLGYKKNSQEVWDIYSYVNENRWTAGRTLSASIGQGEHNYTVLQVANYIASMVNGKTRYTPHILKKVESTERKAILEKKPEVAGDISLSPEIHNAIMEGMGAVTSSTNQGRDGTAAKFFKDYPIKVGGKTGTAQFKGRDSYAWFVGFAPYDKPEIAVAVVVGQGGHGSYASPVAKAIFSEYLGLNDEKDLTRPNTLKP